jgi:hypothetical protein
LKTTQVDWDWEELSSNGKFGNPDNVIKYPDIPWDWDGLSQSSALTEKFVEENFDKIVIKKRTVFGSSGLMYNMYMPLKIVDNHPEIEWDYSYNGLSQNKNLLLPFVIKHIHKSWDIQDVVVNMKLCKDTCVRAIQACWRIYKIHKQAKEIAEKIIEWWYHPDCIPAMKMRERSFCELMSNHYSAS